MTNKTANYQLNQWEPGDSFLRTDFNEDNAKLDAALAGLETKKCQLQTGYYIGDNADSRHIDLGFAPKAVILSTYDGKTNINNDVYGGVFVPLGSEITDNKPGVTLDDTGFTVYFSSINDQYTNSSAVRYHYVAFQ